VSQDAQESNVVLDHLVPIELEEQAASRLHNEFQVLNAWHDGLSFLYCQTRQMEKYATSRIPFPGIRESEPPPKELVFNNISCCYQWYAVTLCNFVELVGAIGWELDRSLPPPRLYIKEVVPAVLDFRNKIAAHIGRARRNAANPAEQLASLLPPSSLVNGRYTAGVWAISIRRSGNSSVGKMQQWSLTETHERLSARYWPTFKSQ
jgi:hypothetical protein